MNIREIAISACVVKEEEIILSRVRKLIISDFGEPLMLY